MSQQTSQRAHWLSKGIHAFLEQVFFSAGNLLIQLFLARSLVPNHYGEFTIVYSLITFSAIFQGAFVQVPLLIIGPAHYRDQWRQYSICSILLHALLSILSLLVIACSGWILIHTGKSSIYTIIAAALCFPFLTLIWQLRTLCFMIQQPVKALKGSFAYFFVMLLSILFLSPNYLFLPKTGYAVITISSIIAAGVYFLLLALNFRKNFSSSLELLSPISLKHWHFGKWVFLNGWAGWVLRGGVIVIIGTVMSKESAAIYAALLYLFFPLEKILVVAQHLFTPALVEKIQTKDNKWLRKLFIRATIVVLLIGTCYLTVLIITGKMVITVLLKEYYTGFYWLLPFLGMITIINSLLVMIALMLNAQEKTRQVFYFNSIGAIVSLLILPPLCLYYGWSGLIIGQFIVVLIRVFFGISFLKEIL